jgi:DNA-binding Lrp family transcriptional regulator
VAEKEILDYLKDNPKWYRSLELSQILGLSRTAVIRTLTRLSDSNYLLRKKLKLKGYEYKFNPDKILD